MTVRNLSLDSVIALVNGVRSDLAKLQDSPSLSAEERKNLFRQVSTIKELFYQIADLCIPK